MGYTSISELLLIIPPAYLQDNINVMPVTHYANCKTWLNPTLTRAMIRSDTRSDWLIQIWEPLLVILDFFAKKNGIFCILVISTSTPKASWLLSDITTSAGSLVLRFIRVSFKSLWNICNFINWIFGKSI